MISSSPAMNNLKSRSSNSTCLSTCSYWRWAWGHFWGWRTLSEAFAFIPDFFLCLLCFFSCSFSQTCYHHCHRSNYLNLSLSLCWTYLTVNHALSVVFERYVLISSLIVTAQLFQCQFHAQRKSHGMPITLTFHLIVFCPTLYHRFYQNNAQESYL